MAISDVLENFRKEGYAGKKGKPEESSSGPRSFKLTDEEVKELQGYAGGPGEEQQCLVTGRMGENGEFSVISVHSPNGEAPGNEDDMAREMMEKMGKAPMMRPQTMPSPS